MPISWQSISSTNYLASNGQVILAKLARNKAIVLTYFLVALASSLLISHLFADHLHVDQLKQRGEPVKVRRQVSDGGGDSATTSSSTLRSLDPFATRPRIQTQNGHLVIQASQDKNIDFKTSGSRGSITINGFRLDQLVGVARAFEQSKGKLNSLGNSSSSTITLENEYELLVRSLLGSTQKLASLQRSSDELNRKLNDLTQVVGKLSKSLSRRVKVLDEMKKSQTEVAIKLKENNCFESTNGQPVCRNGATCLDLYDSYKCLCPKEYEGVTCEQDVDECQRFRGTDLGCQNGGKCVNLAGSYRCDCPAQFHGIHCTERHDDCTLASSQSMCGHGKCVNVARTTPDRANYECICDQGWTQDSRSPACIIDINECAGSGALVFNTSTGSGDMMGQLPVYPCSTNPFVECINLPGSFQCAGCPLGYTGNGRVCRDVDECERDNGGCSSLVECLNLPGTRRCGPCPPGYAGDGITCQRVSACQAEVNGGCHPMARCVELMGVAQASDQSRICVCNYPYVGSGVGVTGCATLGSVGGAVPPSAAVLDSTAAGAAQVNWTATQQVSALSEMLAQLPNMTSIMSGQQQDDCKPNPCLNGAQCLKIDATFECLCSSSQWTGKLCDQLADFTCGGHFHTSRGAFEFPVGGHHDKLFKQMSDTAAAAVVASSRSTSPDTPTSSGRRPGDQQQRQHRCVWSISVAVNMSLRLNLTNLKALTAGKQVQVNQLTRGRQVKAPACLEYLDIVERLDRALELAGARGRHLARVCVTRSSGTGTGSSNRPAEVVLSGESNLIDLEYVWQLPGGGGQMALAATAPADRPSLNFRLAWSTAEPECGGELPVQESGSVSSPRFPEFYAAGSECRYLLRVPVGHRIRIQFGELVLLTAPPRGPGPSANSGLRPEVGGVADVECADSLVILDGALGGTDRPVLFRHCANQLAGRLSLESSSSPVITSSSSTVELVLSSRQDSSLPLLRPHQRRGFYLTYAAEASTPNCGGLYTAKSAQLKSFDFSSTADATSDSVLAYEFARYFDFQDSSSSSWSSPTSVRSGRNTWQMGGPPAAAARVGSQLTVNQSIASSLSAYRTRCEYEIRPADQSRNHKIQLDWLELPSELSSDSMSSLSRWSRRIRCLKSRLMIYDGNPGASMTSSSSSSSSSSSTSDQADSPLLATFCAGDKYNASLAQLRTISSSGHVLYLVYESINSLPNDDTDNSAVISANGNNKQQQTISSNSNFKPRESTAQQLSGFRLRYSTTCSATYRQLEGQIITELEPEVDECLYHILLPPNNTISLLIEPILTSTSGSDQDTPPLGMSSLHLADGSCAAQAVFMDGVMPRGKLALSQMERQLRTYDFSTTNDAGTPPTTPIKNYVGPLARALVDSEQPEVAPDQSDSMAGASSRLAGGASATTTNSSSTSSYKNSYWQYGSSQVHDIKEFDVCKLPALEMNSVWNHMSLMFKLNDKLKTSGLPLTDGLPVAPPKLKILVKYQAESSCGGVISEPRVGSFRLTSATPVTSLTGYPLTVGSFSELPVQEITQRRRDWLIWLRNTTNSNKTRQQQLAGNSPPLTLANCSLAFQELIEIYEPSAGQTRFLCPSELIDLPADFHWTSQSDTLYIRLINDTLQESTGKLQQQQQNSSELIKSRLLFPGRKPIVGFPPVLRYKMLSARDNKCGGRLIQSSGLIQSPRFPFNYSPNTQCVWLLEAPSSDLQFRLNFTRFQLEDSSTKNICLFDYLEIRNGPTSSSPLIGRFCNSDLQGRTLISQSSLLYIKFKSDAHLNRPGFQLRFDAAQTGCGGYLSAASGQIDSPNYPYAYAHGANCEWTIEVARGNRIELSVEDLDLRGAMSAINQRLTGSDDLDSGTGVVKQQQVSCKTEGLQADYLEFLDPMHSTPGHSLGRFCHLSQFNSLARIVHSSYNKLHIVYKSQAQDSGRGFRLTYETDCTFEQELTGFSGVIESPAFPLDTGALDSCLWIIRAPLGANLTLALTHMNLYDGSSSAKLHSSTMSDHDWYDYGLYPTPLMKMTKSEKSYTSRSSTKSPSTSPSAAGLCSPSYDQLQIWSSRVFQENATIEERLEPLNKTLVRPFEKRMKYEIVRQLRTTNTTLGIRNFTLTRSLCGQLDQLEPTARLIELNTNIAIVRLSVHSSWRPPDPPRHFRLEWRVRGCGGPLRTSSGGSGGSLEGVKFDERLNLTRTQSSQPFECIWSYQNTKLNSRMYELDVRSDMRLPVGTTALSGGNDSCAYGSLTLYDGLSYKSPIIMQNCDSQRTQESFYASSGQLLVRFFSRGHPTGAPMGRNFALYGYPSEPHDCGLSVFDINTPFLELAGQRTSPNYPDLYDAQSYKCVSLLTSASGGRIRFTIEELDIPLDGGGAGGGGGESGGVSDDDTPAAGLLDSEACRKSGNYLQVRNSQLTAQQFYCGKFDRSTGVGLSSPTALARSYFVLDQQTAWLVFQSRGTNRGKWKVSYDRLCGSSRSNMNYAEDFATPNYPGPPNWRRTGSDAGTVTTTSGSHTEQVCIWKLNSAGSQTSDLLSGSVVGGQELDLDDELITGNRKLGQKLHLSLMDFVESDRLSESPSDCLRIYEGASISLRESSYNLTELDARLTPRLKICRKSELKYNSMFYVSRGSELTILVTGNTVAKFRVKPYENYCGGEFAHAQAEFASPNFPEPYGPNLDCHYFISGSPGSQIQLHFNTFELAQGLQSSGGGSGVGGDQCDSSDYVELRQLSTRQRVLARFQTYLANRLMTRLSVEDYLYGGGTSGSGKNQSLSLMNSTEAKTSKRRLLINGRKRAINRLFKLTHLFYLFEESKSSSSYQLATRVVGHNSRLAIRLEDLYASSTLIGRYCRGQLPPKQLMFGSTKTASLLHDEILVRLRSHSSRDDNQGQDTPTTSKLARGFLANYKLLYGGLIQVPAPANQPEVDQDNQDLNLPEMFSSSTGFISSPNYPTLKQTNSTISWTFETPLNYVLEFELISLTLGSVHSDCQDSLAIYDGLKSSNSIQLTKLCGQLSFKRLLDSSMESLWSRALDGSLNPRRLPVNLAHQPHVQAALLRRFRSSSNVASVIYDNFRSTGAFLLRYQSIKPVPPTTSGGNQSIPEDPLERPLGAPEVLEYQYNEDGGGELELNSSLTATPSKSCSHVYKLALKFNSISEQVRTSISLNDSIELKSPDWPREVDARELECHWLVTTQDNTNIRLTIDPTASMMSAAARGSGGGGDDDSTGSYVTTRYLNDQCFRARERNFVVIHDGASLLAPTLGRFCLPVPPVQLVSSGRHLLVRYVHARQPEVGQDAQKSLNQAVNPRLSDADDQLLEQSQRQVRTSLFRATAQVGHCGGQYHILYSARITDRPERNHNSTGIQSEYENNLDCMYYLFAGTPDQVLVVHSSMSQLELAREPSNENCTVGDYIEIRDLQLVTSGSSSGSLASAGNSGRLLGRFCAGRPLSKPLESPGSGMAIRFHTDAANTGRGFDLFVLSNEPYLSCPKSSLTLTPDEPYGRLMSPNWPHGFQGKRRCKYTILAPRNQTLKLTFIKLIRPLSEQTTSGSSTTSGLQQQSKCLDSFVYLDDNEARLLRYDYRKLSESISPTSGQQLRQSVRDFVCARQFAYQQLADVGLVPDEASAATLITGSGGNQTVASTIMTRIPEMEFKRLINLKSITNNEENKFKLSTNSHTLLLEYAAKNLAPNEGFLAVVQLADFPLERKCGGDIWPTPGRNLLQSALFNRLMNDSEPTIQCHWQLHFENAGDEDQLIASSSSSFTSSYLVFDVLELPPTVQNTSLFVANNFRQADLCFGNHLLLTDYDGFQAQIACGYLTPSHLYRWRMVDEMLHQQVIVRTRNLESVVYANWQLDSQKPTTTTNLEGQTKLFRGLRAYFHETKCPAVQRLPGDTMRFRSHLLYKSTGNTTGEQATGNDNLSYQPTICQWDVTLKPGHYQLRVLSLNLRNEDNTGSDATTTGSNTSNCDVYSREFDYVEVRAGRQSDAPVFGRFCAQNQKKLASAHTTIQFNVTFNEFTLLFVAGLQRLRKGENKFPDYVEPNKRHQLLEAKSEQQQQKKKLITKTSSQFGFELELTRLRETNVSEFCRKTSSFNIYQLVRSREILDRYGNEFYSALITPTTLYPKNSHCIVDLAIDDDLRFNFTFASFFDLEPSANCLSGDYLEISDLLEVADDDDTKNTRISTTPATTNRKSKNTKTTTTTTTRKPKQQQQQTSTGKVAIFDDDTHFHLTPKPIGRWCGRTLPKGSFISTSSKVRLIFHSNEHIEGKGFILNWSSVVAPANNSTGIDGITNSP